MGVTLATHIDFSKKRQEVIDWKGVGNGHAPPLVRKRRAEVMDWDGVGDRHIPPFSKPYTPPLPKNKEADVMD